MKTLVVLTGGTIGSKINHNIIDTDDISAYKIINMYQKIYGADCDFEVIQPFSELSENFTLDTVNTLSGIIKNINFALYDGIIITHGSDTVAYTSAFISYMFSSVQAPIVFTAANYPPEDIKSNALENLRGAVQFIKSRTVKNGVYFAYGNPDEKVNIYLGTRINEADCFNDRFSVFGNEPFGTIVNDKFIYNNTTVNPTCEMISKTKQTDFTVLEPNSLILKSFTGMNYSLIDIEKGGLESVINIMYHSATACTIGNNTSLIDFIERCSKKDIDVYCVSFKNTDNIYSTVKIITDCGGIPLYNISYESAYAKAVLSYSQNKKGLMQENIFFEHIK